MDTDSLELRQRGLELAIEAYPGATTQFLLRAAQAFANYLAGDNG